jgi:uncharacterized membrane protein YgaE (UPF0421/DUF939 family)
MALISFARLLSFPRPRAVPVAGVVRAAARRTPGAGLLRLRSQPQFIARLTATAVFAYVLASLLPGSSRPVLAPLTAVLVVQATLFQTVRHAVQRVASVTAGVLIALALSAALGFTWWTLGLTIAAALGVGSLLNLGDHILEVPISAMLILSLDTGSAATGRVVDTLVGAAAGLLAGVLLSPVRTEPAENAIGDFSRRLAGLLREIAAGLADGAGRGETEAWLARARALTAQIQQVDETLGEAEDSLRFKPRPLRSARTAVPLRNGLETLEHAAVTIRGLARSITDNARLPEGDVAALAADSPALLAEALVRLAAAVHAYGGLIRADLGAGQVPDSNELDRHLDRARQQQDRLAPVLRHAPETGAPGWRLRGEILVHLDRLTAELQAEHLGRARQEDPSWLEAVRVVWPLPPRQAETAGSAGPLRRGGS